MPGSAIDKLYVYSFIFLTDPIRLICYPHLTYEAQRLSSVSNFTKLLVPKTCVVPRKRGSQSSGLKYLNKIEFNSVYNYSLSPLVHTQSLGFSLSTEIFYVLQSF